MQFIDLMCRTCDYEVEDHVRQSFKDKLPACPKCKTVLVQDFGGLRQRIAIHPKDMAINAGKRPVDWTDKASDHLSMANKGDIKQGVIR